MTISKSYGCYINQIKTIKQNLNEIFNIQGIKPDTLLSNLLKISMSKMGADPY